MKAAIIYTILIVAGIEYGCQAVDAFLSTVNAEVAAFQEKANAHI